MLMMSISSRFCAIILLLQGAFSCNTTCIQKAALFRLEEIKHTVLKELGVQEPVDFQMNDAMLQGLERQYRVEQEKEQDETIRTSLIAGVDPLNGASEMLVAAFPMSMDTIYSTVLSSQLRVFLKADVPAEIDVRVFERLSNGEVGEQLAKVSVVVGGSQYTTIDLGSLNLARLNEILGLYVEAPLGGLNVAIHPQNQESAEQQMILVMELEAAKRRQRRSEPYCTSQSVEQGCCLHDLVVDFKELGWNFIVAPRKYNAYMCRGDCRVNHHHLTRFGHTKVVHDGRDIHPMLESGMCCHPSDYESLKVIYTKGPAEIGITRVPGMIARRCTCS